MTSTEVLTDCTQTVKQNKDDCAHLLEQTHGLFNAIINLHIKEDAAKGMPTYVLHHIGKFTEYLFSLAWKALVFADIWD
jgi:hypothetical protein